MTDEPTQRADKDSLEPEEEPTPESRWSKLDEGQAASTPAKKAGFVETLADGDGNVVPFQP